MNILYVFGGERAQGAEIVIERLMHGNIDQVDTHLILSPGKYAEDLISKHAPYKINTLTDLRKLNRDSSSKLSYLFKALRNYIVIPIKIHQYIKKNNIQIVHANTLVPSSYLSLLVLYSRFFNPDIKWIWSDHDLGYFSRIDRFLAQLCVKLYDKTLLVSHALEKKYPNSGNKTTVLYNGLNVNVFKPNSLLRQTFRNQYNIAQKTIVIGIAGVINEDKGQIPLIQAFKQIAASYSNVILTIAGGFAIQSPDYSEKFKEQIHGFDNIRYLGFVNPINGFYNGCDILINNSNNFRSESLGTTIYEAMAYEKIVIAANTGGTPEIITDGKDGFLFEPESVEALSEKITFVLNHFDEHEKIRSRARQKVMERFNIDVMLDKYNNILLSMIDNLKVVKIG
jgi:glycosyltransferase involved in cell wall biosynthesis